ncbi:MAG: helix-turn-helix domain-containing protein [Patescibacteria group bacterium]|nr:helix-turn-helix domain-containing protein [Patescibacteria group bacterium]MBU1953325.1 helix-turn-helix domain-containing protein [Patescibacteria group bacterium]
MIKLENKLYSSTEVAEVLGVSLRSVYRYLEEGKLDAEVKTATGRHRFTRQNILDFLYPTGLPEDEKIIEGPATEPTLVSTPKKVARPVEEAVAIAEEEVIKPKEEEVAPKIEEKVKPVEKEEVKEEEPVDWLAKFREAAKKFEEKASEEVTGLGASEPEVEEKEESKILYYRSRLGGLKDIAQNIDKTSKNSGLDYAFTLNAGLSLYRPINPFSTLHVYIRSKDKDFFERILALTSSDESSAQLCMIISDDEAVYSGSEELHGLRVVDKKRLVEDIGKMDENLLKDAESILK